MANFDIIHDLETRSECDLLKSGAYKYAEDETTEIMCSAYIKDFGTMHDHQTFIDIYVFPNSLVERRELELSILSKHPLANITFIEYGLSNPQTIDDFARADKYVAFNIEFELSVMATHAPNIIVMEPQKNDVAARARVLGLPHALGNVMEVLNAPVQKNKEGHRVMLQCCKPKPAWKKGKTGPKYYDDVERLAKNYNYCIDDCIAEMWLHRNLPQLQPMEDAIWREIMRENREGVLLDVPSIEFCQTIIDTEIGNINVAMLEYTTAVCPLFPVKSITSLPAIKKFCTHFGYTFPTLGADALKDILKRTDLPHEVRYVLAWRQYAGKASTAKLISMLKYACKDGRARGIQMYAGTRTLRTAGRGLQPLNLPRPDKDFNQDLAFLILQDLYLGAGEKAKRFIGLTNNPFNSVSYALRGMLRASPNHFFNVADYSAVEACGVMWLCDEWEALAIMKDDPSNLYLSFGGKIAGYEINKKDHPDERFVGKTAVLGLGYSMGGFTFMESVKLPLEQCNEIVKLYRETYPNIKRMWGELNDLAVAACESPGQMFTTWNGKISFIKNGTYLRMILPNGRSIFYPNAKTVSNTNYKMQRPDPASPTEMQERWFKQSMTQFAQNEGWTYAFKQTEYGTWEYETWISVNIQVNKWVNGKWAEEQLYGGLLLENACQACSRDIMCDAMLNLRSRGYVIKFSVYDELVTEVSEQMEANGSLARMIQIMETPPEWAAGFPIAVEAWSGLRFKKD